MTLSRRAFVHRFGAGSALGLAAMVAARGREGLAGRAAGALFPALEANGGPIRLDSNENPNGPCQASLDALRGAFAEACRYPHNQTELPDALARLHRVKPENVLLGCGSTEILRMAVLAFTTAGRPLVQGSPTFESPARDAEMVGTPVISVPVDAALRLDLAAMADKAQGAGLVFLCNPNNPTGTVHGAGAITDFIGQVLRISPTTCILVDEAYHEYVDDPGYRTALPLAVGNPQVIVSRTFSKVYGMAGLRIGYAVGRADTLKAMARFRLGNSVNVLAAAGALAGLSQEAHVARQVALNVEARAFTRRALEAAGFQVVPPAGNFMMVNIRRDAKAFQDACGKKGLMVGRPFPPLTTYSRISVGTLDEMQRAVAIVKDVLAAA